MNLRESYEIHIRAINVKGSGKASSYISALKFIDVILERTALFGFDGLWNVDSVDDINRLYRYALENQKIKGSVFLDGTIPPSYGERGHYSAALKNYCQFIVVQQYHEQLWDIYRDSNLSASELSEKLTRKRVKSVTYLADEGTDLKSKEGKDAVRSVKTRLGQGFFRDMILQQYKSSCCITGLTVPEVLRASHISSWAKDAKNRLNPSNGLCLSATYDAAFDKHLISFDDDYRLILSPDLKEHYTNRAFKDYFRSKEGSVIKLPKKYIPDLELLQKHREQTLA